MKKFIAILLLAVSVFVLSGCDKNTNEMPDETKDVIINSIVDFNEVMDYIFYDYTVTEMSFDNPVTFESNFPFYITDGVIYSFESDYESEYGSITRVLNSDVDFYLLVDPTNGREIVTGEGIVIDDQLSYDSNYYGTMIRTTYYDTHVLYKYFDSRTAYLSDGVPKRFVTYNLETEEVQTFDFQGDYDLYAAELGTSDLFEDFQLVDKLYGSLFDEEDENYYYIANAQYIDVYDYNTNVFLNSVPQSLILNADIYIDYKVIDQQVIQVMSDSTDYDYVSKEVPFKVVTTIYDVITGESTTVDVDFIIINSVEFTSEDTDYLSADIIYFRDEILYDNYDEHVILNSDLEIVSSALNIDPTTSFSFGDYIYDSTLHVLYDKDFNLIATNVNAVFPNLGYIAFTDLIDYYFYNLSDESVYPVVVDYYYYYGENALLVVDDNEHYYIDENGEVISIENEFGEVLYIGDTVFFTLSEGVIRVYNIDTMEEVENFAVTATQQDEIEADTVTFFEHWYQYTNEDYHYTYTITFSDQTFMIVVELNISEEE